MWLAFITPRTEEKLSCDEPLRKSGFKGWEREIEVAAGERVPVKVELEKK